MSAQQVEVQTLRGPGEGPPPSSIPPAQGRLSFRVKVALVWAGIFAVMAVFFAFAKFDWAWMRANFKFIATGVWVTILTAVAAIATELQELATRAQSLLSKLADSGLLTTEEVTEQKRRFLS